MPRFEELFVNELLVNKIQSFNVAHSSGKTFLDLPAGYLGKFIETGTYGNTADLGITLSADNTRPVTYLFDDGDAAMTGNIRGVLSRVAVIANHTGALTLEAIRGQVKFVGGVDFDADYAAGISGYIEIADSSDFNLNSDDHAVCAVRARVEVGASLAVQQGFLTGVYVELNTTGAWTVTQDADGILAGMVITITDQKNDAWGHGIYMAASAVDTGMTINAATTGISLAGAMTTGLNIGGAATEAINITGSSTRAINIDTGTFGTGITLGGTLTTGITIGACTNGITITGATTHGIHITGASTTAGIGVTQTLAANDDHAIEVITTTAATGGSVRPVHMVSTLTGAGAVGGRAEFEMTSNVALGGWANALKGYFNMGDSCTVSGLGSAVLAEMKLPGASLGGVGSYGVLELELVTQASGLTGGAPVAFQWMQVSGDGTATADWEDNGYVMILKGLTEGTGNIFSAGADVAAAATLRILVGSTDYYILLATGESD